MVAKKKVISKKKVVKKVARKPSPRKSANPMMLDGKSWDMQKVMDHLCTQIATSTKSIKTILGEGYEGFDLPSHVQIFNWLKDPENKEILIQYELSKNFQGEMSFEAVLEAHKMALIPLLDENGKPALEVDGKQMYGMTGPSVAYAKLFSDNMKFAAVKLRPKKYGDKVDLNHGGQEVNPLSVLYEQISGNALPIKKDD